MYFLPTIIGRHKADALGIFIVNLLFGWTVIGWFAALIWACSAERYVPVRMVPASAGRFCSQVRSAFALGSAFLWYVWPICLTDGPGLTSDEIPI